MNEAAVGRPVLGRHAIGQLRRSEGRRGQEAKGGNLLPLGPIGRTGASLTPGEIAEGANFSCQLSIRVWRRRPVALLLSRGTPCNSAWRLAGGTRDY